MTAATSPTTSVRVSQAIRATRERLFRAWTDPEELMHWWRMEGEGWAFAGAEIDLRAGGRYRLSMTSPDGQVHTAFGAYREVDPPRRLAFTWNWENPANGVGETLVTVEFNDLGGGMTDVVIIHDRFTDAARAASHQQGWTQLLRLLSRLTAEASA